MTRQKYFDNNSEIIEKWYKLLGFPKEYDTEFYCALREIQISDEVSIEKYDITSNDGKRNLLSLLFMCERLAEKYREKGISDKILFDTLRDLEIWTKKWSKIKGELFLGELNWLRHHFEMQLFQLGRLQFYMGQASCDIPEKGIKAGDKILDIHIPEGEPLLKEVCLKSVEDAKNFFAEYFPDYDYKCFICHSWLLDTSLEKFLKPESNILQFGKMFEKIRVDKSDAILRYLFQLDTTRDNLKNAVAYNSFTDAIKRHAMNGGELYEVLGVLR